MTSNGKLNKKIRKNSSSSQKLIKLKNLDECNQDIIEDTIASSDKYDLVLSVENDTKTNDFGYKNVTRITRPYNSIDEYEMRILECDPTRHIAPTAKGLGNLLCMNPDNLSSQKKLIWLLARYDAFCSAIQSNGMSISKLRSGRVKTGRNYLLELIWEERRRIFGKDAKLQPGETSLKVPPFTHFLRREELLFFGIAQTPYEIFSVDDIKHDLIDESASTFDQTDKLVHAIVLDSTLSLRQDMGTRFIMYFKFGNGNEPTEYADIHFTLQKSWIHEIPIRVVRSYNCYSRYAPIWGHRYDGLYRIINVYSDNDNNDIRVWVYVFSACNINLVPPMYNMTMDGILKFKRIKERTMRGILFNHTYSRLKILKSLNSRNIADIKHVNIIYRGKKLFTIGIPHLITIKNKDKNLPIPVNLCTIYNYIKHMCIKKNVAKYWLRGPVREYEKLLNSKLWWAKGKFLPLKLIIQRIEHKKQLIFEFTKLGIKEKILSKKIEYQKSLAINYEMAKVIARPFFPQSDSTSIWTYIELCEPFPRDWNPYVDISAGSEVYPIPVENEVDSDLPPMGFTYIRNNVFFSRLPQFNLEPICAGCSPEGTKPENCYKIAVNGFCKGYIDENGSIYCDGINKRYLSTIRSRAACSDNCPCPNTCTNRLPDGLQVPVKLIKVPHLGWALHTRVPIASGTFIMQYVGEIICRSEMASREHHYDKLGHFNYCMEAVEAEKQYDDWQMPCLDSMVLGNIARFLNHSCEPNVEVITVWKGDDFPCIGVYALCDISAGEALTYCYGSSYRSIPCLCGAKSCRGYIGNI